jgi:hypothetical protein
LSFIESVRNKINLFYFVPSYMALDSDLLQANLMLKAPPMKRVKSSVSSASNPPDEVIHGLILTQKEKDHLVALERSCVYIETKSEMNLHELCDVLREYGTIKIIKEHSTGYWAQLLDMEDELTIKKFMS